MEMTTNLLPKLPLTCVIDYREKDVIKVMKALISMHGIDMTVQIENVPLADIILQDADGNDVVMFERKKLSDLASSIKDGRYNEQSLRLHHTTLHNHNIVYVIEGNMDHYSDKYTRVKPATLYSCLVSLLYYKGFSVLRTLDMQETCEMILRFYDKIAREAKKGKECFYRDGSNQSEQPTSSSSSATAVRTETPLEHYSSVVKKIKKDNIVPENIGHIILSQIPGISHIISKAVLDKHGSLYQLMFAMKEDPTCLDNMRYVTKSGQERRISHKAITSIREYLFYQKSNIIQIET